MHRLLPLAALAAGLFVTPAAAQERAVWSGVFENDLVSSTDRNYTSGAEITRAALAERGGAVHGLAEALMGADGGQVVYGLGIGQSIFTPQDKRATEPLPDQHPYAGWLYLKGDLLVARTSGARDRLGLQVGVIGPASLAEETQNFVHDVVGAPKVEGWDNQIGNEPGFTVSFERQFPPRRLWDGAVSADIVPTAGVAAGTILTQASLGLTARFGLNLPDHLMPQRVKPALAGTPWWPEGGAGGAYLFVGTEGRAVARNAFIEGRAFSGDVVTQDAETWVYDIQAGGVVTVWETQVSLTYVRRSEEFADQARAEQFAAIGLARRF
ncbi:lipid A deacylase LpxR family protein [Parvularcula dongshanensis]|uniref:DUF2219 domain-containing protein n=1 Tax=Parvularcula dongshanensis TaxID=1173995 RepID=A0A840I3K3_9PROT|nr:lipid A deacylase LpxR family protein [Parvularcula dongshanensis]MBB4659439.1 hypothetical protein [Parvularcula dongshanensis]